MLAPRQQAAFILQQFCPDLSIYVCLYARSTRAAKLPIAAD